MLSRIAKLDRGKSDPFVIIVEISGDTATCRTIVIECRNIVRIVGCSADPDGPVIVGWLRAIAPAGAATSAVATDEAVVLAAIATNCPLPYVIESQSELVGNVPPVHVDPLVDVA